MKGRNLVLAGWLTYAEHVLPSNAPPTQRQETRRAFYAGAAHMFNVLAAVGGDEFSEDDGVEVFEGVSAELRDYVKDVERGLR